MAVRITQIKMSPGGVQLAHISQLLWVNETTGQSRWISRQELALWIKKGGRAYTRTGAAYTYLEAVPLNGQWGYLQQLLSGTVHELMYVRTQSNSVQWDNLLSLPGGPSDLASILQRLSGRSTAW